MMRHQTDPFGTAMENDNKMMPPATETRVTDNREQLMWHTIGESEPDRVLTESREETEATQTTILTVRFGINVDRLLASRPALLHVKQSVVHQSS